MGNQTKDVVFYTGSVRNITSNSLEEKYMLFYYSSKSRKGNKKKNKFYYPTYYDAIVDCFYVQKPIGKQFEEMIEEGRFKVVDFIPKSYDKKRYKCGSVHSLMQNSIPGRGQIKTYMHDTDGMHI